MMPLPPPPPPLSEEAAKEFMQKQYIKETQHVRLEIVKQFINSTGCIPKDLQEIDEIVHYIHTGKHSTTPND